MSKENRPTVVGEEEARRCADIAEALVRSIRRVHTEEHADVILSLVGLEFFRGKMIDAGVTSMDFTVEDRDVKSIDVRFRSEDSHMVRSAEHTLDAAVYALADTTRMVGMCPVIAVEDCDV